MIMNLQGQLTILKSMNIKPNFSELAREYDLDRRTVKKYYEGYEGKSKTRNKSSRLDQYYIEIKEKLAINGVTINGVYQYFKDKYGDIGTYSNFNKYLLNIIKFNVFLKINFWNFNYWIKIYKNTRKFYL